MSNAAPAVSPRGWRGFVVSTRIVGAGRYDPGHSTRATGGTMRHTITVACLLAATLALAGCSSGSNKPTPAVTVTKTPKLSAAEQQAACITAWGAVIDEEDPATPAECGGLKDQAGMYMEALRKRNAANREKFDECTRDPSCTEWPIATP